MTPEERYRFDLQGYLVRPHALSANDVQALNVAVDMLHAPEPGDDLMSQRYTHHLTAARKFRDLIDHESVFDVIYELCGPTVRLDHSYGIIMNPGQSGLGLHGSATPFDAAQYYTVHGGEIRTGLVAVQWALVDHPPGGGGFICVPGSHKANFPPPRTMDADLVRDVPMQSGDVVIFTEALTHATAPWRASHQRRTLLYKYSPGNSSWGKDEALPPALAPMLTERQRLLFEPPYVAYRQPLTP